MMNVSEFYVVNKLYTPSFGVTLNDFANGYENYLYYIFVKNKLISFNVKLGTGLFKNIRKVKNLKLILAIF